MAKQNKAFEFGPFRLEVRERRLTRGGHIVPLRGRVFDTLYALITKQGCLVTKDELMAEVWPDNIVEETNLNHNISVLRRALGEKATGQKYVETVPRQGYRFVADVKELDGTEGASLAHTWNIQESINRTGEPDAGTAHAPGSLPSRSAATGGTGKSPSASRTWWGQHQGIISSLVVAVLLVAGFFSVGRLGFMDTPSNSRIMLVVLPFENLTGDSGEKYVADGFSYEIISQLGRWNTPRIGVIGRTSSQVYQGAGKSISEIGRELGVAYVVEGSLRRDEDNYRITVMLVRVEDQAHLWAENYNRTADNVTATQVEVARTVMNEIGIRIGVEPEEVSQSAYPQGLDTRPNSLRPPDGQVCPEVNSSTLPLSAHARPQVLPRKHSGEATLNSPGRFLSRHSRTGPVRTGRRAGER